MAEELILIPKAKYQKLMHSTTQDQTKHMQTCELLTTTSKVPEHQGSDGQEKVCFQQMLRAVVPKKFLSKAEGLLDILSQQKGDSISWTDRGVMLLNGKTINNSNLVDLIRCAVVFPCTKAPVGYAKVLEGLHVPTSLINHRDTIQRGKGFIVKQKTNGAPPGFKSKKQNQTKKNKVVKILMNSNKR